MEAMPLDGNAAAGALDDLFAFDVTTAVTTCATCRDRHTVGELLAYMRAPGMVLRCSTCDAVQLRMVHSADRTWVDSRGVQVLEIPGAGQR